MTYQEFLERDEAAERRREARLRRDLVVDRFQEAEVRPDPDGEKENGDGKT